MKRFLLLLALTSVVSGSAWAVTIPGAYQFFSRKHNIPSQVLFAVCLQESGKRYEDKLLPWPWTLNVAGKGFFFDTPSEAQSHLLGIINNGSCKVDIGICQVHWCAHKKHFSYPTQLLNPYQNLDYAARLIRKEYDNTVSRGEPSWWIAVGRYHSPNNPRLAKKYRESAHARWERLLAKSEKLSAPVQSLQLAQEVPQ